MWLRPVQDRAKAGGPRASPWVTRASLVRPAERPPSRLRDHLPSSPGWYGSCWEGITGARFLVRPDVDLPAAAAGVPGTWGSASPHTPAASSPPRLEGFEPGIGSLRPFPRPPRPPPPGVDAGWGPGVGRWFQSHVWSPGRTLLFSQTPSILPV